MLRRNKNNNPGKTGGNATSDNKATPQPVPRHIAKNPPRTYGLLAKFNTAEGLVSAAKRVYDSGYRKFDAYTPYPVEGLPRVMHMDWSPLPYIVFIGGLIGGLTGFFGMTFATVIDYPLNIGGRPLFSWPAYIPITFEMTVLFAAFAGVIGLFVLTRFPQPYHPVFNSEDFNAHASQDAFYLDIQANDPKFDPQRTRALLQELGSVDVSEIEA